ncbi:protein kinase COQ8 [Aspergillus clavatus NRRL 1]|uniref:Molecular chaperone (ABC1), putative n=1 Tax=Aspergillus clavatus (strain ATCC 1007 / CBS 513.65 / DSM 816 / NCTC 3887 / NRRL 1 / QM 1276 / 107) TaxID=344612 RepID=A1CM91_ASPCL|nr:molecular chaperone (ABC1), putative [Aspergillus clavatus NRRL 1]EAW08678.1 molecular chaperone (ABC1), putative [Aspergillus clavatus NRRL 1]
MSGKRLLDAIQFFDVAKSVATKHLVLRQRQLDVFTRTSSLTKGIQRQTEGLILTAQAAAALAKRFNEASPPQSAPPQTQTSTTPEPHAGTNSVPLSPDEAKKAQRQAEFQIPSSAAEHTGSDSASPLNVSKQQDVFYRPSRESTPGLSGLPRVKLPKTANNTEVNFDKAVNADVFHSPIDTERPVSEVATATDRQDVPDEVMKDIFHSPRVARMLSQKPATSMNRADRRLQGPSAALSNTDTASAPTEKSKQAGKEDMEKIGASIAEDVTLEDQQLAAELNRGDTYMMTESRVPSSRLGRLWQYGGLATSMAFGAVGESLRRVTGSQQDTGSLMFSAGNMERLVAKLSKMRGAALKLGQMLSFQDNKMLPEAIHQVLQRVQDRADYMPASQRDKVLADNLGPNWRDLFSSFDEVPMAAASIGQVHGAVLKSTSQPVAVKVQYPGVADSIDSDLNNLSILLTASRLLPRGLYLDKTIANARTELGWECDYIREAECGNRFKELVKDDPVFLVPEIIPEASSKQVLTMERLEGIAVTKVQDFTQAQRDWIGTQILRLCLREITEFRFMQTDPNWTNFLYNGKTNRLELLDFGASREYPVDFISKYIRTLIAASRDDRDSCHRLSIELGYLTGHESKAMVDAHVASILTLAEPFMDSSPDVYDFRDQTITDRVRELIPVMIRERLVPPPEETYSLHRKLSGAFLLCARLGSQVRCKELFADAIKKADETGLDVGLARK